MKVKNIVLTALISTMLLICAMPVKSNAAATKELGILSVREGGYGYQANVKNVWKIVEYKDGAYTYDNAFYCLRGGKGFGGSSYIENKVYNISYDMKKISLIPNSIRPILPSDEQKTVEIGGETYTYSDYNAVLWLLDNMYLPKDKDATILKQNLMSKAFPQGTEITLTDDDIEVVQQLAIWYFTNVDETNEAEYAYHMETLPALQLTRQEGGLGPFDLTLDDIDSTWTRQKQAETLYDYLITTAKISAEEYGTGAERGTVVVPAELQNTSPQANIAKGKCIVGPFRISQKNIDYEITGNLTDQNNNEIAYTLLDKNKQPVAEGTTLKDLANEYFYLEITDNKEITKLTFSTTIVYNDTQTTFWTVGGSEILEQPVVEVKKIERKVTKDLEVEIERKYFDLSLRKFITTVNENKVDRVPDVDTTPFKEGKTTAIYDHSKMPLSVAPGDIVKYKIRIYNEGQLDGYANEIADYIPEGLGFIIGHNVNADNHWIVAEGQTIDTIKLTDIPNARNNVKLSDFADATSLDKIEVVKGKAKITTDKLKYNENDTKKTNLIPAYDEEMATIYSRDVEVVCVVLGDIDEDTDLKNIAEISKAVDEYGEPVNEGLPVEDRDSQPGNVNINEYPDSTNVQDDDDFEKLVVKDFDLALRKFITAVGDKKITDRNPMPRINATTGAITYEHPKDVVRVKNGDLVEYTIRVYNEGSLAGHATIVRDTLPDGLEFVKDNAINKQYKWDTDENDNQTITTEYLANKLIPAFDKGTMKAPKYEDLKVVCKVNVPNNASTVLINTAEIQDDSNENGGDVNDKDSTPGNNVENEDDIDIEKVQIVIFDLSLKKFITEVNEEQVTDRIPNVTIDENGLLKYSYKKDPVEVKHNDIVIYTIRVYNEGNINGYAEEIKDDVPQGLVFLPDHAINTEYKWTLDENGAIWSDYLSSENGEDNELDAFNKDDMDTPDYRDVKVAFKVDETNLPEDRTIINTAEIKKHSNEYDVDDEDSTPDNNNPVEDDIDKEYLKVKYFDLALLKYITQVYIEEDGKTRVVETGHTGLENPEPIVKVEINKRKIKTTKVSFVYTIKVTNEGEIAGYAKEIIDRIPEGLEFVAADNPNWSIKEDGSIITNQLEDTLLNPGESATVEIMLRWINGEDNLKAKTNVAEINEDYNDSGSKDIDSTPGNNVEGEDDIDDATVILSIKTGIEPSYIGIVGAGLVILAAGTALIRRFIM